MTRTYALLKLLEHGQLSIGQIEHITCWPMEDCRNAVTELRSTGQIVSVNRTSVYALAEREMAGAAA